MRHLFVFICDEIEPVRLVARRSDQGRQTLGLGLLRGYARGVTVKRGGLYTQTSFRPSPVVADQNCKLILTAPPTLINTGQSRKLFVTERNTDVTGTADHLWERACVGAGLLANAVCQPTHP